MATKPAELSSSSLPFTLSNGAMNLHWTTSTSIFVSDLLTLALIFFLAVLGRHSVTHGYHLSAYFELLPFLAMILCAFWFQGLYPGVLLHPAEEMRRIFLSVTTICLLMAAATFLFRNAEAYSRAVFLITWSAGSPLVLLTRYAVRKSLANKPWWGVPALLLGSGPTAERVVRRLQDGMLGIRITNVLSEEQLLSLSQNWAEISNDPRLFPPLEASQTAQYVIVALPEKSKIELRNAIQMYCRGFSHVLLLPDLPGLCSLGISAREVGGEVGLELPQRLFHRSAAAVKRGLDLFISISALLILLPVFLTIAIATKLSSRGPVFFGHLRYGRNGKTFKALKFRTMVPDASRVLADYLAMNPEFLEEWTRDHKLKNDPRVTGIGKWLRRFSLDELPQLFNVFRGQMSLVGPRPIVYEEIAKYGDNAYDLYTRVLPGITGLWQVSGRNNTTYAERVTLDEYYVRNWSIWMDAYILFCTLKVVVRSEGAY